MNLQITKKLNVIDGETLMDARLPKRNFCVETLLPEESVLLIELMKQLQSFDGGNTELAEKFNSFSGKNISAKVLKQIMNKWRYTLEENNVFFTSGRSNGKRYIKTWYLPSADESDGSAV